MVVTQEQHDSLEQMAETIGYDIKGDFPDLETAYDLYIESDLSIKGDKPETWGVIDMGDAWQGVHVWDEDAGTWIAEMTHDPQTVIDAILRKRGFYGA